MKFVGSSSLSDQELGEIAQSLVDAYGENAPAVVNNLIDEAKMLGDFAERASWVSVSLGVVQLLRPERFTDRG